MEEKKRTRVKFSKVLYYILLVIFAGTFCVSLFLLGRYWLNSGKNASQYDSLASILASIQANQPTQGPTTVPDTSDPTVPSGTVDPSAPTEPTEPTEPQMLPEYKVFYDLNNDTVGWITIPDTKINYPVMQTPDNRDYYLNHDFKKQWSAWGAIYARENCDINAPSDNITLYGHHMMDGSMFAELDFFKKKDFWQTHQTFSFDTLYEHHTYQIFAVFKTSGTNNIGYPYHRFVEAESEEAFNEFVSTIKRMAFYETGITAEYGDKLLCLSTCEYTQDNGRFVVVAKRIS